MNSDTPALASEGLGGTASGIGGRNDKNNTTTTITTNNNNNNNNGKQSPQLALLLPFVPRLVGRSRGGSTGGVGETLSNTSAERGVILRARFKKQRQSMKAA